MTILTYTQFRNWRNYCSCCKARDYYFWLLSEIWEFSCYIVLLKRARFCHLLFSVSFSDKWLKKLSQSPIKNVTLFHKCVSVWRALGDECCVKCLISLTDHSNLSLTISSLKCILIQVIALNTFFCVCVWLGYALFMSTQTSLNWICSLIDRCIRDRRGEDLSYLSGKGNSAPRRSQYSQCIIEEHFFS